MPHPPNQFPVKITISVLSDNTTSYDIILIRIFILTRLDMV